MTVTDNVKMAVVMRTAVTIIPVGTVVMTKSASSNRGADSGSAVNECH